MEIKACVFLLSGQSVSCLAWENKHSRKVQEKFIKYSSYVGDNIDQMSKRMMSVKFAFEGNCVGTKEVLFVLNPRLRVKTDRWYYRGPESYRGSRNTRSVPKRKRWLKASFSQTSATSLISSLSPLTVCVLKPACNTRAHLKETLKVYFSNRSLNRCSWDPEVKHEPCQTATASGQEPGLDLNNQGRFPKEHLVLDSPEPCESSGKEETPSFPFFWLNELRNVRTPAPSLPLVAKSGSTSLKLKRQGGGEAEEAVCRSPPFRNRTVYWHNVAIAEFFH